MPEAKHTESLPTVAPEQPKEPALAGTADMILSGDSLDKLWRFAQAMSKATITVPEHLRGKEGDCMAVAMQAAQWRMNPFTVAQKTHLVNGVLGYEAQLVNAVVQGSGAIVGAFHYEYQGEGDNLMCRVGAVLRGQKAVTWGEWLRKGDVKVQNSPLWKTNPKQQLGYLQVKNWSRAYTPGAILGIYTPDELEEVPPRDMGMAMRVDERPAAPARRSESKPKAQPKAAEPASKPAEGELVDDDQGPPEIPEAITDGMLRTLRSSIERLDADETALCLHFKIGTIEELPKAKINEAMEFVRSGG